MISVVHTGGYAVIQVKQRRDINLKLFFSLYCNFWHIFRTSDKVI